MDARCEDSYVDAKRGRVPTTETHFAGVNNGGRTDDNENNGAAGCVIKKRR